MSVTVGIIAHNLGEYLPCAIESALGQAEVVVFDDGSTDYTPVICADYDVRVVRRENASGSAAWGWNALIETCATEWFMPLSADDEITPDAAERIERCVDADWVYADLELIDADSRPAGLWSYASFPHTVPGCLEHIWRTKSLFPTMIAAFRTEFVRSHGLDAWYSGPFMDTLVGASWLGCWPRLAYIGHPFARYRQHPKQETHTASSARSQMVEDLDDYMVSRFGRRALDRLGGFR